MNGGLLSWPALAPSHLQDPNKIVQMGAKGLDIIP